MKVEFIGKSFELNDHIKAFVEHKLGRIKRLIKDFEENELEVVITLSSERSKQRDAHTNKVSLYRVDIDMYIKTLPNGNIHAWEEDKDVYAAIDKVIDEVERQILKLKQRRLEYRRKARQESNELEVYPLEEEKRHIIVEDLNIDKPLSKEDAVIELEENHLTFMPFIDIDSGKLCIVYRKRNNHFGIIETNCKP